MRGTQTGTFFSRKRCLSLFVFSGLGDRFVARVREVLERIESMPEIYGPVWQDVRAAPLRKFRHLVYYVVFADRVEILAVMHGSRDASAWQSRV